MSLRLALVAYDVSSESIGGASTTCPRNLCSNYMHFDSSIEIDLISVTPARRRSSKDEFATLFNQVYWKDADFSIYDFVIFTDPLCFNNLKYPEIVDRMVQQAPRYGMICHDEYCLQDLFRSQFNTYVKSDKLKYIQYISPRTRLMFHEYFDYTPTIPEIILPVYKHDDLLIDTSYVERKDWKLVNAGRLVSRKKILYLLNMIPHLNLGVEVHGVLPGGMYQVKLENHPIFSSAYKGIYPDGEYPSRSSWISWNCVLVNRGYTSRFAPRIELGTIESLKYCTFPILLTESLPDWFPRDYPLAFSLFNELGRRTISDKKRADIVNDRLDVVKSMAINDRISCIANVLDTISSNVKIEDNTKNVLDIIYNSL